MHEVKTKYKYSDMKPGLPLRHGGNVEIVYDEECVKQSIMNIFSTVVHERVRNPIGSGLLRLLFQPVNDTTAMQIRREMVDVIEKWEPRVDVVSFDIQSDVATHSYDVEVSYRIRNIGKSDQIRTRMRSFS